MKNKPAGQQEMLLKGKFKLKPIFSWSLQFLVKDPFLDMCYVKETRKFVRDIRQV